MKKKKLILLCSIFLVIILAIYFIFFNVPLSGKGTINDPYLINDYHDLKAIQKKVNSGLNQYSKKYLVLNNDLDLANTTFSPIGNKKHPFLGYFDGNNHKIKNITIESNDEHIGFFGNVYGNNQEEVIKNLTLENITINLQNANANAIGALIGHANGISIANCHVLGHVNIIKGYSQSIGGIIGYLNGKIYNCSYDGEIYLEVGEYSANASDLWSYLGGIIGQLNGEAYDLENQGKIIFSRGVSEFTQGRIYYLTGGIVGSINQSEKISRCLNYGDLQTLGGVGGIVGNISTELVIESCFNYGKIDAQGELNLNAGGILANGYYSGEIINSGNYGDITVLSKPNHNSNDNVGIYQNNFIGGILGSGYLHITNCLNKGNITITGDNLHYAGGIAGATSGKVINCYNVGDVNVKSSKNSAIAGGVVSVLQENYNNSYTDQDSKIGVIENCYNNGIIQANKGIGGAMNSNELAGAIVGFNMSEYTTIQNNVFNQQILSEYIHDEEISVAMFWYGEEYLAENIVGEHIINNQAINTNDFNNKDNFTTFGEFVSLDDINPNNVWIFTDTLPILFFESLES